MIKETRPNEYTCFYCGCVVLREELHKDHFIPLSRGGKDNEENLVASCSRCNRQKGAMLPEEFFIFVIGEIYRLLEIRKNMKKMGRIITYREILDGVFGDWTKIYRQWLEEFGIK